MTQHGKKYAEAAGQVNREELHGVRQAVDLVKELARAKFDETIELAIRLGVDPRKADQIVRGTLTLPSGSGGQRQCAAHDLIGLAWVDAEPYGELDGLVEFRPCELLDQV